MNPRRIFLGGEFLITDVEFDNIFTPEDFTDEHKMIQETANDFVTKEAIPNLDRLEEKDHDLARSLLAKSGELGLLGTDVPEEYGGLELDKVSTTIGAEVTGGKGPFSIILGTHTGIGTLPLVYFGNETQKEKR